MPRSRLRGIFRPKPVSGLAVLPRRSPAASVTRQCGAVNGWLGFEIDSGATGNAYAGSPVAYALKACLPVLQSANLATLDQAL